MSSFIEILVSYSPTTISTILLVISEILGLIPSKYIPAKGILHSIVLLIQKIGTSIMKKKEEEVKTTK